jgi:colanic acid/amylovoran biosynthesis protein
MNILVVNQHGENRGDEAAMRAMINSFEKEFMNVKFNIIAQFKDKGLKIEFNQDVNILNMLMPIHHAMGLGLYAVAKFFKIKLAFLLIDKTKDIIEAYRTADMVVSAPGGPYFGDIYYKHELVHWFYIWLSSLYKKPIFLYAPSAGPFNIKLMNIIRKHLYQKFSLICVREEISRKYLQDLLGRDVEVYLTADSALQETLIPYKKKIYFSGKSVYLSEKYIVAVSAIKYKYPGENNVAEKQSHYTQTLLRCLEYIGGKKKCHFLFFPQLYGKVHSDVPYLKQLGQELSAEISWEIVDPDFDSNIQRCLFGMANLCIASRYHPQIFAASSGVPGICIYYEHKALGFMSVLGMKDFAFDIRNLDADAMCSKLDEVMDRHDELSDIIMRNIDEIQKKAKQTTKLTVSHFTKFINSL